MMTRTQYLLMCLNEELGELAYHAFKAARFGVGDFHPITKESNIDGLKREYIDVQAILEMLKEDGVDICVDLDGDVEVINEYHIQKEEKKRKVEKHMKNSVENGCLDADAIKKNKQY